MTARDDILPQLVCVTTVDQIKRSMTNWVAGIQADPQTARSVFRTTRKWVHDPETGIFGPTKFVGFVDMTIAVTVSGRKGSTSGVEFDGREPRYAIEQVLSCKYCVEPSLSAALELWARRQAGPDIFDRIDTSKWKFISLPRSGRSP